MSLECIHGVTMEELTEMNLGMSKRVAINLPDKVHQDLERWAKQQGRPVANLTAFLVETAIREALEKGEIGSVEKK